LIDELEKIAQGGCGQPVDETVPDGIAEAQVQTFVK
jgi:hypothetical protein